MPFKVGPLRSFAILPSLGGQMAKLRKVASAASMLVASDRFDPDLVPTPVKSKKRMQPQDHTWLYVSGCVRSQAKL